MTLTRFASLHGTIGVTPNLKLEVRMPPRLLASLDIGQDMNRQGDRGGEWLTVQLGAGTVNDGIASRARVVGQPTRRGYWEALGIWAAYSRAVSARDIRPTDEVLLDPTSRRERSNLPGRRAQT